MITTKETEVSKGEGVIRDDVSTLLKLSTIQQLLEQVTLTRGFVTEPGHTGKLNSH